MPTTLFARLFVSHFTIGWEIPNVHRIIGLRNVLAHGYAVVDDRVVWAAASTRVPELREALFTEALFAELQGTPVAVTVVFPGAIATDITSNSGVIMPAMSPSRGRAPKPTKPREAGRQIVRAVKRGSYRVLIGKDVTLLDRLSRLAPRRATLILASQMKDLLDGSRAFADTSSGKGQSRQV